MSTTDQNLLKKISKLYKTKVIERGEIGYATLLNDSTVVIQYESLGYKVRYDISFPDDAQILRNMQIFGILSADEKELYREILVERLKNCGLSSPQSLDEYAWEVIKLYRQRLN